MEGDRTVYHLSCALKLANLLILEMYKPTVFVILVIFYVHPDISNVYMRIGTAFSILEGDLVDSLLELTIEQVKISVIE